MDITMYDCGFGDCFLLDNKGSHLLVDFGIHKKVVDTNKIAVSTRYDDILRDLSGKFKDGSQLSFLLSHYHDDHFGGVDYMINTPKVPKLQFKNIYIPDVWDVSTCIEIVALLMISFLRKGLSLFTFLKSIISLNGTIHLISTRCRIENHYQAIWPDKSSLREKAMALFGDDIDKNERKKLLGISKNLINAFNNQLDIAEKNENEITIIETDWLNALNDTAFRDYVDGFTTRSLNSFGNEVSIVFHNIEDTNDNNILFTGDVGTGNNNNDHNDVIDTLVAKKLLYQQYKIIKFPHHGTLPYFSDELCNRLNRTDPYLLISNGSLKNTYLNYLPTIAYSDYCQLNITNPQIIRANDFGPVISKKITI